MCYAQLRLCEMKSWNLRIGQVSKQHDLAAATPLLIE